MIDVEPLRSLLIVHLSETGARNVHKDATFRCQHVANTELERQYSTTREQCLNHF